MSSPSPKSAKRDATNCLIDLRTPTFFSNIHLQTPDVAYLDNDICASAVPSAVRRYTKHVWTLTAAFILDVAVFAVCGAADRL
jgi:hypothetical protein